MPVPSVQYILGGAVRLSIFQSDNFTFYILQFQASGVSYNSLSNNLNNSQRSLFSSVASGLWSVMTLGYGSSSDTSGSQSTNTNNSSNPSMITYLPSLPNDSDTSSSNVSDSQIDCENRLLAWQRQKHISLRLKKISINSTLNIISSCHILLILSNHCTNESLCNPFRLALFHFTDTQGTKFNFKIKFKSIFLDILNRK